MKNIIQFACKSQLETEKEIMKCGVKLLERTILHHFSKLENKFGQSDKLAEYAKDISLIFYGVCEVEKRLQKSCLIEEVDEFNKDLNNCINLFL